MNINKVAQTKDGFWAKYTKYRTISALVAVFLLLTTSLALLTVYSATRFDGATDELEVITRKGVVSYKLSDDILNLNLLLDETTDTHQLLSSNVKDTMADIEQLTQIFDDAVNSLSHGGDVVFDDGTTIYTDGINTPELALVVQDIEKNWQPYHQLLQKLVAESKSGNLNQTTVEHLLQYNQNQGSILKNDIAKLRQGLNEVIHTQSALLQKVQIAGILLAIMIFIVIMFNALRRLADNDFLLQAAQRETTDIMKTVNEGLFLINKDLRIGEQYSDKLESILGQNKIAGRNFYDLLIGMVSQKDLDTTKLFVEQLYNPWVVEDLIQDLNPLRQVKINYFEDGDGGFAKQKYLDFNFLRVNNGDNNDEVIDKVFVSVVDITEAVQLQQNLEIAKAQHERELDMIGNILAVDSYYLLSFIDNTAKRIEKMNGILKSGNTHSLTSKAQELLREMHSLKGEASALKLEAFVGIAEEQEAKLKRLLDNNQLSGNDFLGFTVGLDKLLELNLYVNKLLNRLRVLGESVDKSHNLTDTIPVWQNYFKNYAADIAARHNKKVLVNVQGFDDVADHQNFNTYKDIAVQLLKNAIVHGIESPEQRITKGKKEAGIINLKIEPKENSLKLSIEDDGQGINFEDLRQKAVELGYVSATEAETLTNKQLYTIMIRKSGLSTATSHSEDAGRGVGMSLIYNLAQSAEGKLEIDSKAGKYTRMAVGFPLV